MFAKLFGEGSDQVLIKLDNGDDGPEVRIYFKPEGLGVCSFASAFEDSDEGWDAAEVMFSKINEDRAFTLADMGRKEALRFVEVEG